MLLAPRADKVAERLVFNAYAPRHPGLRELRHDRVDGLLRRPRPAGALGCARQGPSRRVRLRTSCQLTGDSHEHASRAPPHRAAPPRRRRQRRRRALVLLRPAQVWTAGEPLHAGWVVLIEGARIAAVGARGRRAAPAGSRGHRAAGRDAAAGTDGPALAPVPASLQRDALERPGAQGAGAVPHAARRACRRARRCSPGFTTLRDLGTEGADYADVSLKRAIEDGLIVGPAPVRRHARHRRHRQLRARAARPAPGRVLHAAGGRGGERVSPR